MPIFIVDAAHGDLRLDDFVARHMPGASASWARRAIARGEVTVDGRSGKKGIRVRPGQVVAVASADARMAAPTPEPEAALSVLHVDDALVAVDKPAGISSHPLRAGERGTIANALCARYPECAEASEDPREGGLAHRLDRGTSGVLLAARGRTAWHGLRAALGEAACEKVYLAEVVGRLAAGSATGSIGRVGRRGAHVRIERGRRPLPARTDWEVVQVRASTTLIRARLHAGRAHQVRAHLAAAGHPVVGDDIYGAEAAPAPGACDLHLHAAAVRFVHPATGQELIVRAPPPPWAQA